MEALDANLSNQVQEKSRIILSTERLTFEMRTGEISTSVVTMYNRGSVAVYFDCVRDQSANTLPVHMVSVAQGVFA